MTGKRMRKLLMGDRVPRNLANKISHACKGGMSHQSLLLCLLIVPGLMDAFACDAFACANRMGIQVDAAWGDTGGKPFIGVSGRK